MLRVNCKLCEHNINLSSLFMRHYMTNFLILGQALSRGRARGQSRHADVGSPEQRGKVPYWALKTKQSSVVKTGCWYFPTSGYRGFRYVGHCGSPLSRLTRLSASRAMAQKACSPPSFFSQIKAITTKQFLGGYRMRTLAVNESAHLTTRLKAR